MLTDWGFVLDLANVLRVRHGVMMHLNLTVCFPEGTGIAISALLYSRIVDASWTAHRILMSIRPHVPSDLYEYLDVEVFVLAPPAVEDRTHAQLVFEAASG